MITRIFCSLCFLNKVDHKFTNLLPVSRKSVVSKADVCKQLIEDRPVLVCTTRPRIYFINDFENLDLLPRGKMTIC